MRKPQIKKIEPPAPKKGAGRPPSKRKANKAVPKVDGRTTRPESDVTKLNKEKALKALREAHGRVHVAAEICGVHHSNIYDYINCDEDFKKEVDAIRERLLDLTELKLIKKINGGDFQSIKYFLDSKGQSRGYGKKDEDAPKVNVTVVNYLNEDEEVEPTVKVEKS